MISLFCTCFFYILIIRNQEIAFDELKSVFANQERSWKSRVSELESSLSISEDKMNANKRNLVAKENQMKILQQVI